VASGSFPTTHWSLILSVADERDGRAEAALAELCRAYWYPIYSFIRVRCPTPDQAQDLTQEFFLSILARGVFGSANPAAGRFRSFLAVSLKHFLADQADRRNAWKRGGRAVTLPINLAGAEKRFEQDLAHHETPERVFDRQWALAVVNHACDQLGDALDREGRCGLFRHLRPFLAGGSEPSSCTAALRTPSSSCGR
jgi:DNA-directed RNA polymerase specialized sigma24 family protein